MLHLRPLGQLSVYVIPHFFQKLLERTDGKNNKIFNFRTEEKPEIMGFLSGANSQLYKKFRVSPVMTTSIPLLVTGCIIPYFPLGCNFFFCGVYFDAAAHVLMGEGGRLWRSGC